MKTTPISIHPNRDIDLGLVADFLNQPFPLELSEEAKEEISKSVDWMMDFIEKSDRPIYGINTGFGSLCETSIDGKDLNQLQANLVMSHAVGAGDRLSPEISRLMLWFKAHSLSKGYSGVKVSTVQRLLELNNQDLLPVVYEFGSLGASGDLAPLAHLSLPLIGKGEIWDVNLDFKEVKTFQPNKSFIEELGPKEGLALLNGTQFMSSIGAFALIKAYRISYFADLIAALSIDAFNARPEPFDERLHLVRKHSGQRKVAERMRNLLMDSETFQAHKEHVQDPYSFRCIPQVHGASHAVLEYVRKVVEDEINSVTDNPTLFRNEAILSGGNFHGQPIAMALDYLALAISEWGSISERRVYQLISASRGLSAFLISKPGLNSGFMIPQYTAASIASRNKALCMPASADSIPSSNNQEDHVSMGANSATKLLKIVENVESILAIELMNASQALWLSGRKTSAFLEQFLKTYREIVPPLEKDRVLFEDLRKTEHFLRSTHVDNELLFI